MGFFNSGSAFPKSAMVQPLPQNRDPVVPSSPTRAALGESPEHSPRGEPFALLHIVHFFPIRGESRRMDLPQVGLPRRFLS